jgi:hypothetical protein
VLKLSHGLVLTGWRARPKCNIILNCAGSPIRLLRQKLQDRKAHFLLVIYEKTNVQHSSERIVYYSRYTTGKVGVAESASILPCGFWMIDDQQLDI